MSFLSLMASVSRRWIMTETTRVSFRTLSNCFPLVAFSHFPLYAGFSPFLTLGYCSSFHHFVPGSSLSDQYDVLPLFSLWNSLVVRCFENSLVLPKPIQSDAKQNPVILTCVNPPRPFLWVLHLLLTELGPILCRNLERYRPLSVYRVDLIDLVQLHELQWPENAHGSCTQPAFLVRFGRLSEHIALRHILFFGNVSAC